jgi:hypothetical protein
MAYLTVLFHNSHRIIIKNIKLSVLQKEENGTFLIEILNLLEFIF